VGQWNPHQLYHKLLQSAKVAVCCAISPSAIIGHSVFEDDIEITTAVIPGPCVQVINIFLTQDLARYPQINGNKWFQGNEATLQTARNLISAARHLYSNHVLLRNGDSSWPARSRDLSPCDSYLGLLKR